MFEYHKYILDIFVFMPNRICYNLTMNLTNVSEWLLSQGSFMTSLANHFSQFVTPLCVICGEHQPVTNDLETNVLKGPSC